MITPQLDDSSLLPQDQLVVDALHSVRQALAMEVAFVSEFKGGHRIFRYVDAAADFAPIAVGGSHPLEETYCQRVIDGRLPEVIRDTALEPEAAGLEVTRELRIGAYISVPIKLADGRLHGTLCCFSAQANSELGERDLQTMRLFADFVAKILSREFMRDLLTTEHLRKVIDEGRFAMVYQPIVNVALNTLVGHEALARFTDEPAHPPDFWFNEAAKVGLQQELEIAAIAKALTQLDRFPADTYLSLNVSPCTILSGAAAHALAGQALERLVVEVTEHESVDDYSKIARALKPLRDQKLRLAVDDAGAGFASFRHILKLQPDIIKLDGSLIGAIDKDLMSRALAAALVRFAQETGSRIVAEGVETEAELQVLRELGVNKAQGYLFGHPRPCP